MPNDAPMGRHRATTHRGTSRLVRTRDHFCDRVADTRDAMPSRRSLALAAVGGVLATGTAVGAQATVAAHTDDASAATQRSSLSLSAVPRQAERVSRDAIRPAIETAQKEQADREKAAEKKKAKREKAEKKRRAVAAAAEDPRGAARAMLADFGWAGQFACLDALWNGESGWDPHASNPGSGAYGIPQALPGSKMASAGSDWRTNPLTQIRWGLDYIKSSYGSPCSAESFKQGHGWY